MTTSVITSVATAVTTALNAVVWSPTFTAVRKRLVAEELSTMNTLAVSVVEKSQKTVYLNRGAKGRTCVVQVLIQKRAATIDAADIDPLVGLAEAIGDAFLHTRLATYTSAACVAVDLDPVYSIEHLESLRQFTSVVSLEFEVA